MRPQAPSARRRSRPECQARWGSVAVEFAFVAPVFFVMVLGIFEFGRAMMVQTLLTSASQQGARAGALNGAQAADVTSAVTNYLSGAGVSGTRHHTPALPSPHRSSAAPGTGRASYRFSIPLSERQLASCPSSLSQALRRCLPRRSCSARRDSDDDPFIRCRGQKGTFCFTG